MRTPVRTLAYGVSAYIAVFRIDSPASGNMERLLLMAWLIIATCGMIAFWANQKDKP